MLRHFGQDRNPMLEFSLGLTPKVRFLTFFVILSLTVPAVARTRSTGDVQLPRHLLSETLMRQRALRKLRGAELPGARRTTAESKALALDYGSIAVMQDDGTLFTAVNAFNLDRKSVV